MTPRPPQPKIHIERTQLESLLDVLGAMALLFGIVYLLAHWANLPEQVPMHFDIAGKPDGWGPKSALWLLPGIGGFIFILLTVLRPFPHKFNYPFRITENNAERQYRLGILMIAWLKTEMAFLFTSIVVESVAVAMGRSTGLSPVWIVFMAAIFVTIGAYFVLAYRRR